MALATRNSPLATYLLMVLAPLVVIMCRPTLCQAERVRFHFAPIDASGTMTLAPRGEFNAPGERISYLGARRQPAGNPPRPTHVLFYNHPYSGRRVAVPLAFPEGTPRIEYRGSRVIYNYGSYTVEVHFNADGTVDVVYNSGLFRPL